MLGLGTTQGLDNTTLSTEAQYLINFSRLFLILNYNGNNSFLFVNATKTYQFKAKRSEIKNISGNFSANNLKKAGLNGCVFFLLIVRPYILVIISISINS